MNSLAPSAPAHSANLASTDVVPAPAVSVLTPGKVGGRRRRKTKGGSRSRKHRKSNSRKHRKSNSRKHRR